KEIPAEMGGSSGGCAGLGRGNRNRGEVEGRRRLDRQSADVGGSFVPGNCAVLQRVIRSELELVVVELVGDAEYRHWAIATSAAGFAEPPATGLAGLAHLAPVATRSFDIEAHRRFHQRNYGGIWAVLQIRRSNTYQCDGLRPQERPQLRLEG